MVVWGSHSFGTFDLEGARLEYLGEVNEGDVVQGSLSKLGLFKMCWFY